MDHGSASQGKRISRGAIYTITVRSRYKFESAVDFTIDHIEVVQVVQDENNTIPLVTGKSFVLRVFPKLAVPGPDVTNVPILVGFKVDNDITEFERDGSRTIITNNPDRANSQHSYNIFISPQSVDFPDGNVSVAAVINPECTVPEVDCENNAGEVITVQFEEQPGLRVKYLPICIQLHGEPESCPEGSLANLGEIAKRIFPVAEGNFEFSLSESGKLISKESLHVFGRGEDALMQRLEAIYVAEAVTRGGQVTFDQLIGILPEKTMGADNFGGVASGIAAPLWGGKSGRVALVLDQTQNGYVGPVGTAFIVAHEIGHNLGLRHPETKKCESVLSGIFGKGTSSQWPFPDANIQEHGADVIANDIKVGKPASHPNVNYDLMDSCDVLSQWISDFHYVWVYASGFEPTAAEPVLEPLLASLSSDSPRRESGDFAFITGKADRNGVVGELNAVERFTGTADPHAPDPGQDHCLSFADGTGALVGEHCFQLPFVGSEGGRELEEQYFSRLVKMPAGAARVSLRRSGAELDSVTASARVPVVKILSPSGGERWEGSPEQAIRWTGTDEDGDLLRYSVFYSPNGNTDWRSLATGLEAAEYRFDPSAIRGGSDIWFRVTASDGFHRGEADVGPIDVVQHPEITVSNQPVDLGEAVIGQSI